MWGPQSKGDLSLAFPGITQGKRKPCRKAQGKAAMVREGADGESWGRPWEVLLLSGKMGETDKKSCPWTDVPWERGVLRKGELIQSGPDLG